MTHGVEVTRLDATDIDFEMPDRTQQGILGGIDVIGTSTPEYMAPSSVLEILAPSMDSERGGGR